MPDRGVFMGPSLRRQEQWGYCRTGPSPWLWEVWPVPYVRSYGRFLLGTDYVESLVHLWRRIRTTPEEITAHPPGEWRKQSRLPLPLCSRSHIFFDGHRGNAIGYLGELPILSPHDWQFEESLDFDSDCQLLNPSDSGLFGLV